MKYDRFIPSAPLAPFVESLAISEAKRASLYSVFQGTGPVIGFQYKGKLALMEEDIEKPLSVSGVTGMFDKCRNFKHDGPVGSVLVYFSPGGAAAFFKQPVHEIFGESLSLDNFMLRSELLVLEEKLQEAKTDSKNHKSRPYSKS